MRRFPMAWAILIFAVVMGVVGWRIYAAGELRRLDQVRHITAAPSEKYVRFTMRYDSPPVYEEEYRMQDVNGLSNYDYRIRGYNGKQITIQAPDHRTTAVSFFYEDLDHLINVWQLQSKPPRGNTSIAYTLYIKDVDDYRQGDRTVQFTDPHYWATTAGHQYHIDLRKSDVKNPSDLLKMQSTALADDRYQRVVDAFRGFGPPSFRDRIATAQRMIRSGH